MRYAAKFLSKFHVMFAAIICFVSLSTVKSQPSLTKAIDYDGDGRVDGAVFRPKEGIWYFNGSSTGFSAFNFGIFAADTPVPGDYDGDGKGDVAVWREANGNFYYIRSSNYTFYGTQFGVAGDEPIARDYDGDGKTDLAVLRRSTGKLVWYVLKSSDLSFFGIEFGLATDHPAPGDYDGDGKFDFAVQRRTGTADNSDAIFFIFTSAGVFRAEYLGYGFDKVVPGDYDGDGKTDIAVAGDFGHHEDLKLEWRIRKSSGGEITIQYGDADLGHIPVQGDYNGDGKTDIAVWQSTDGFFFINGVPGYQFGASGDFPIASYDTH